MNIIETNSLKAWILAIRPKTLTAASIPVMIGCALAYVYGYFQFTPALLCFLFAFLMQIDANFINDLYDFLKGTDREDRLGPKRACAQGWITTKAMKVGIILTTLASGIVGLSLLYYGGIEMIPVGIACILFAFLYTAGPYPLAYHGWGDALVLIFSASFRLDVLLCNGTRMEHRCNFSFHRLWTGYRYFTHGQQLPRQRTRHPKRETDARGAFRSTGRTDSLFSIRHGSLLVLCLFYHDREIYAALLPQIYLIPHILTTQRMAK